MLETLKAEVFKANLELPNRGLIKYTWGNVSAFDAESQLFVIKPSGVDYDVMKPEDMVVCNLDCEVVEGDLKPSSDMPTHAVLYKEFGDIGSVVHTHSPWATTWAQSGLNVPAMGTTHADTFYGEIPCARFLTTEEINKDYEYETGNVIVETFKEKGINPHEVPAVLLHGYIEVYEVFRKKSIKIAEIDKYQEDGVVTFTVDIKGRSNISDVVVSLSSIKNVEYVRDV